MVRFRSLRELDATEGTVKLVDAAHQFKDKGNTDIVLIPQPSDDINDPLNWPAWKKALAFSTLLVFTSLVTWVIGGLGTALVLLIQEFGRDLNDTATSLISWSVLTLGAGNFFWVPTALYFGKRPSFLVASFLFFGTIIWSATATSFESLVAARVLSAFAGAITEGLASAITADLFFLHERGWWMGVYFIFLNAGSSVGSLVSAWIIGVGWRWHFWLTGIVAGINALSIFFFFPETQYYRKFNVAAADQSVASTTEGSQDGKEIPGPTEEASSDTEIAPTTTSPPKRTFFQELNPWSGLNPNASYLHLFFSPWPTILYPAAIFSFLTFSTTLAWFVCLLNTSAAVFQAPPYLMSTGINGLINISSIIGIAVFCYLGGALTDKIAEWAARRNNGVYEPEARLLALVFPFVLVPVGLIMYGVGVQHESHWAVPFIGYGIVAGGLAGIPAITLTYVIDCYFLVSYEALLMVNGLKNMFGFGFSYAVVPWIRLQGFQGAFGTMVGIQCGVMLFAIPLYLYGKKIRHASASWKLISW